MKKTTLCEMGIKSQIEAYSAYIPSGWLCTRWGEIAQSLYIKYLYESHCKSCKLMWASKEYYII